MENEILKINILSITISGLLMLVSGAVLYYFKDLLIGGNIRFFLPIPPIGVAAYLFVFNMFKHYHCVLPEKSGSVFVEMLIATAASTGVFFIFTATLILLVRFLSR